MVDNEIVNIDNIDNYSAMSKVMGVDTMKSESSSEKRASSLARIKIQHSSLMGEQEINGKMKNIEVVEGGNYAVELADGVTVYSPTLTIKPFMQRFSYKRYVNSTSPDTKGYYHKTVMADNLNVYLHDNRGTFNCGKPAGYIKDFKALSEDMQTLIKTIRRVRVIFGLVTLDNPVDASGNPVKINDNIPFIFEVDNRTSFKTSGEPFDKLAKRRHLPIQHTIKFTTEQQAIPTGATYYTVVAELGTDTLEVSKNDASILQSFLDWIQNHNEYIMNDYKEHSKNNVSQEDKDVIDEFLGAPEDLESVA